MKIAILGTGRVGGTLGRKWAQAGHAVVFGTRDAGSEKVLALVAEVGHGAAAAGHREAAATADVILLAVPWAEGSALVQSLGGDPNDPIAQRRGDLELDPSAPMGGDPRPRPVQRQFQHIGRTGQLILPVLQLAADAGFQPEDAGPLRAARFLEPMALLWISMANRYGREKLAFSLFHR